MSRTHPDIPGYTIIKKIGTGGMSIVYLAEQDSLKRPVALKLMRPHISDEPHAIERFIHEAKTIAALYHPNIVTIHDVGEMGHDCFYYTMPYLVHGDLSDRMLSDDNDIKNEFSALCDGLFYAHKHGVIHRDLKPENILYDEHHRPQIADFGIALSSGHEKWTKGGRVVGSLKYLSPEQAQSKTVDHRADIYALGVMMYEVLAGELPFDAEDELSQMMAHVDQEPDPLPANKSHWQTVIDGCLAKAPEKRFKDCQALKEAIASVHTDAQATAQHTSIPKRQWPWAVLLLLLMVAIWVFYPDNAKDTPSTLTQPLNTTMQSTPVQSSEYIDVENDTPSVEDIQNAAEQLETTEQAAWITQHLLTHLKTQPELAEPVAVIYWQKLSQLSTQHPESWHPVKTSFTQQLSSNGVSLDHLIEPSEVSEAVVADLSDPDNEPASEAQVSKKTKTTKQPRLLAKAVTVNQFRTFANATALQADKCKSPVGSVLRFTSRTWNNPGFAQKDNHPVVCVTWHQAQQYARWLSQKENKKYRLPKPSEWQAALTPSPKCSNRAGTETARLKLKGDRFPCRDGHLYTSPATAAKQGNVKYWLQGCKEKNKLQSLINDDDPCDSHPVVGQSWASTQKDRGDVEYIKSHSGRTDVGFWLVLDQQ